VVIIRSSRKGVRLRAYVVPAALSRVWLRPEIVAARLHSAHD
jgi:hypothetical protein